MTGLLRKDLYYVKAYAWPYLPLPALLLLLAALAAGATYVSFRVSVRFYRKRQNGAYT